MNSYTLFAVGTNEGIIDQIQSQQIDPGLTEFLESGDGSTEALYAAINQAAPVISFESTAVKTALDVAGYDGYSIATAAVTLFFKKTANGGSYASGSNHIKLSIAAGMIVPRTLTAEQGQAARISMDILPVSSDGSTYPITEAASQALSGSPTVDELFTVGKASLQGSDLDNVQSLSVDFGITVERQFADGLPYPVHQFIITRRPTVTIGTNDAAVLSTYGLEGAAISGGSAIAYLRKVTQGAARVADITAEHISITVAEGRIKPSGSASQDAVADFEVMVQPTYDGSNDAIAINTAVAIA